MAHILIIDDSPTDVKVFSNLLEKHGHQVSSAGTAEDGIELARRDRPDLVIMDVILPGMNGFQATRTLSRDASTSDIPVIIVSTKNMETDRVWGLRQGAKDYLVKPPTERDLISRINQLLGGV
jgi:twitching motility two-component system response regulator PilH